MYDRTRSHDSTFFCEGAIRKTNVGNDVTTRLKFSHRSSVIRHPKIKILLPNSSEEEKKTTTTTTTI